MSVAKNQERSMNGLLIEERVRPKSLFYAGLRVRPENLRSCYFKPTSSRVVVLMGFFKKN
jgi:hypothetical protein